MNAHEVKGNVKISCGCSDEVKAVSVAEAVKSKNGPGLCSDCGKEFVVSTKFTGGFKK